MSTGPIRRAACLAMAGACVMIAVLAAAIWQGDFRAEGSRLLAMPWGVATLVDVYVGLLLFSGWIMWREANRATAVAWVLLVLGTGNLGACLYVLRAVLTSDNTSVKFWTGESREA